MEKSKKCWQDEALKKMDQLLDIIHINKPKAGDQAYFMKETVEVPPLTTKVITEILDEKSQEVLHLRGIGMTYHPCTIYKVIKDTSTPLYKNRDIIQEPNDFGDVWSPPEKVTKQLDLSIYNLNKGKTSLNESLSSTNQVIRAVSTLEFPNKGFIRIDDEVIYYNDKTDQEFLECQRGMDNTTKAKHPKYNEIYLEDNILKYDVSAYGFIRGGLG